MSIPVDIPHGGREDKSGVVSDIFSLLFPFPREQQSGNGPSGIRDFTYSWQELEISPQRWSAIWDLFREKPRNPSPEWSSRPWRKPLHCSNPGQAFAFWPLSSLITPGGFLGQETILFPRKDHLHPNQKWGCPPFFAATAGEAVTVRCRNLNDAGDQVYSYVLDTLGSVVAEKASERMMEWLETQLAPANWAISDSYSPGYCNWDVAEQQKLFSFFPPGFLGITLLPSSLMNPVKSISGVIGAGPGVKRTGYRCHICTNKTCIYRRIRNPHA